MPLGNTILAQSPKNDRTQFTVNKIGGENMSNLKQVKGLVKVLKEKGEDLVLVVSAFRGVTNALIDGMVELNDKGKKYDAADIEKAFKKTKEIHLRVLGEFFTNQDIRAEAEIAYDEEFTILEMELQNHKGVATLLEATPGSFPIYDHVIGFGERMAGIFLNLYLKQENVKSHFIKDVNCADVEQKPGNGVVSVRTLHEAIRAGMKDAMKKHGLDHQDEVVILGGHVGNTPRGMTVDIGRSYSDTTAVDVGLALLELTKTVYAIRFWKAVDGVMTGDPKYLNLTTEEGRNTPKTHPQASLRELLEADAAGSSLVQIQALSLALSGNVDLQVVNISKPESQGTTITASEMTDGRQAFKMIVANPYIDTLTIDLPEMADTSGFIAEITSVFKEHCISIDGCFTEGTSITFSIPMPTDESRRELLRKTDMLEIQKKLKSITVGGERYEAELEYKHDTRTTISIIGHELVNKPGITADITGIFGAFGIDIKSISHGEKARRIMINIESREARRAVQLLHSIFIDQDKKVIAEFIRRRTERTLANIGVSQNEVTKAVSG